MEFIVSSVSEKSLLFVMALALGLIIAWLIATDPVNSTATQTFGSSTIGNETT